MQPLIDKLGVELTYFSEWIQKVDWEKDD